MSKHKQSGRREEQFDDLVGNTKAVPEPVIVEEVQPEEVFSNPDSGLESEDHSSYGWEDIGKAPRNGVGCFVSEKPTGEGVLVFWKKTRAFANATHRWEDYGKFVDFLTGVDLNFKPLFYKPRF